MDGGIMTTNVIDSFVRENSRCRLFNVKLRGKYDMRIDCSMYVTLSSPFTSALDDRVLHIRRCTDAVMGDMLSARS